MSVQPTLPTAQPAHGFVLSVGLTEEQARSVGTSLERITQALEAQLAAMLPVAQTRVSYLRPTGNVRPLRAVPPPAAVRRAAAEQGLVLDLARERARLDGGDVDLSMREFQLLKALVLARGSALTRDRLCVAVWEDEPVSGRVVDVTIRRLRSRLADYEHIIRTVRGVGYRFEPQPGVRVLVPRTG